MPSTATAIIEDSVSRAAAGASRTRLQRAVHQHIVTTPCKREYKSAVQRVMNEQIIARNLSPKREPAPAQIRLNNIPNIAAMALVNSKMQLSKKNLEAMRREKEDLAAQLREEQCKERAERVRKEREEKAMKAQRRREEKEIEERLKAEARKQKEERDERRREVLRLQKSPGRTKTTSRVVSPARVLKVSAATDARVGTKLLFPCTPGRAPSKLAKVLGSGEETSREPTMNTPSREIRRKVCVGKKTCTNSEDSMEDGSLSPRHHAVNQLEFTREERKRIMKQEHERQKRLREEETRRMNALNGQDVSRTQLRAVDNAVNHMHDVLVRKEERRLICEEEKKQWLKKEDSGRLDMDVLQKNQEEKIFSSKENEIDMIILDGDSSCQQKSNKQLRISEKKDIFVADKKEGEERRGEEEQAKTLDCMNIGSSTEQSNRVLQNISVNAANSTHKLPSVHSSYELTPDKILKPSSENNYNIEDLSSGDETDQEDAPRKKVPTWAEGNEFRRALENQSAIIRLGEFDFNEYFGEIAAPDLPLIFGTTKRYPRRGSSGVWESPIGKPRQGIGAFQNKITRKFWYIVSLPFNRVIPGIVFKTVVWLIIYNVSVRLWKGPDHPINRFQWRRMEKAGTLPDELLHKKKVLMEYYKLKIMGERSKPVVLDTRSTL
ncbi:inner centromere protein, ARK binding region [Dictyocaulus viviparus]|uniref:Inner centromere protein, ARK binding region n=1 Tax=Dictyocaulus viviparus TaxID=29172 RepID=A0A0D8XKU5_DICVI|nr:inner centromere protein, ARK binding region [Dictyocaulus viviparus]